jgi:hypothetical protein
MFWSLETLYAGLERNTCILHIKYWNFIKKKFKFMFIKISKNPGTGFDFLSLV